MNVTRRDMVIGIAARSGLTVMAVDAMLVHFLDAMSGHLAAGEPLEIRGFCTMKRYWKKARQARNPRTGAIVDVPGHWVVRFVPGKDLKRVVGG